MAIASGRLFIAVYVLSYWYFGGLFQLPPKHAAFAAGAAAFIVTIVGLMTGGRATLLDLIILLIITAAMGRAAKLSWWTTFVTALISAIPARAVSFVFTSIIHASKAA
ncbi:MAG: hypothetical protein ABIQ30_14260 [Devosia sp.]